MTVPPPSDPRQPHPLESDGHDPAHEDVQNHDPHEDTGPLHVPAEPALEQPDWNALADDQRPPEPVHVVEYPSRPIRRFEPHDEGPWSGGFPSPPPPVIPRQVPIRVKPDIPVWPIVIASAIIVVLGGLGFWIFGASEQGAPSAEPSVTTPAVSAVADARDRLRELLPPGYSEAACEPVATPKGAVAKFGCERNSDSGGPPLATYTLVADEAALKTAFEDIIRASDVVVCPGSIQSPGPWRRNATPQRVAGTLFCGYQRNLPTVAWTDDAELLVSAIRGDEKGPSLPQLYAWWTSHS